MDSEGLGLFGAVFASAFLVYLLTLCPTVYSGDSGDLITASYTFGVAHPTGYPLYMLVGRAFSLLPFGSVAFRYNLMSAVFSALTAVFVCMCVWVLTRNSLAAVGGGLFVAYSQAVWDQATVAEVYGMNGFFVSVLLWLALRWREKRDGRYLRYFALSYGLGLTNHASILLYLPAFLYLILAGNVKSIRNLGLRGLIPPFIAPLLLYLYLPLAAMMNPPYNWGDPNTVGRFLNHVGGSIHRQTYVLALTGAEVLDRFLGLAYHYLGQFSVVWLLVLCGIYKQRVKNRVFLWFTGLMVASDVIYAMFLNDVSLEVTTFCIPSIIVLGVWSGFGLVELLAWLGKKKTGAWLQQAAVAAAVVLVAASNFYISDKSKNYLAYDFGMNILRTVDSDAVVFAQDDNVVFPLSYLLLVEKVRPDVTMYEQNGLLSHGLYGEDYVWLSSREHMERQMSRESEVIGSGRQVYYATRPEFDFNGYKLVQTGLLYRIIRENETLPARDYWGAYEYRQVWNSTISLDYMNRYIKLMYYTRLAEEYYKSDKARAEAIMRGALDMNLRNMDIRYDLGNLLLGQGRVEEAIVEFDKALEIDPNSAKVHNNLGYAYAMLGRKEMALQEYLTSLKQDQYYLKARYNLAGLLLAEGEYDEAAKQYTFIVSADPAYAKAYLYLGVIYNKRGDFKGAAAMWRKYLDLEPNSPDAAEIEARIGQIESGKTG